MPSASLYIHIPFCIGKCLYCSFNSCTGMESHYQRYVKAVTKEISLQAEMTDYGSLQTIYIGGGTPSVLSPDQIGEILSCCCDHFAIDDGVEISMEVNPKTVDLMKFLYLRQAGVNRISIGIQSFLDRELQRLGRLHSAQQGWDCVRDALGAGFSNISLDLMSGIPGQTPATWQWSIETALSLDPAHLSLYQLTVEEGTGFQQMMSEGKLLLPEEDDIVEMDRISSELCRRHDLEQYEIANFALRGSECRHNLNYWHNNDYFGVGAGAVRYFNGIRSKNIADPLQYCEKIEEGRDTVEESEKLSRDASFRESVVVGLRMTVGVSCAALQERYGIDLREYYGAILHPFLENGMVEFTETHFRFTEAGRPLANQILAELV